MPHKTSTDVRRCWFFTHWYTPYTLSYPTLMDWAIPRKVAFTGYPCDPIKGPDDIFQTLSGSESEMDMTIGLSNPNLVHFDTPHLNIGQREPNMLFFQNALLSSSQNGLSVFTQRAFKGRRCNRSWIRKRLQNRGAFPKKICKIQPKSLLPAHFPGKKVRWVCPRKHPSKGGK